MRTKPSYHCKQPELYTALRIAWRNCKADIAAFAGRFSYYTINFCNDKIKAIDAAEALPDFGARVEARRIAHINLLAERDTGRDLWQFVKEYVENAFDKDVQRIKLDAAGYKYYDKSEGENWSALSNLMKNGEQFIKANEALLKSEGGMPDNFIGEFEAQRTKIQSTFQEFLQYASDSKDDTADKTKANNKV